MPLQNSTETNYELPIVVNKHWQEYDTHIGRGTIWGNDWSSKSGTRALYKTETVEQAISCYRKSLWNKIKSGTITLDQLRSLRGLRIGCSCAPRACHGDVIVAAVRWVNEMDSRQPNT